MQACSQKIASGCITPTTNLDAPTRNFHNVKEEHAEKPAKIMRHPTASMCRIY
jgi:hypothetical protein